MIIKSCLLFSLANGNSLCNDEYFFVTQVCHYYSNFMIKHIVRVCRTGDTGPSSVPTAPQSKETSLFLSNHHTSYFIRSLFHF